MATPRRSARPGADRSVAVAVEGLVDFQRALGTVSKDLPKELRAANKEAAEHVARAARARAQSLGGVAAKVAPSIKSAAEQRASKLVFGGPRYPMAMGANFGAYHDRPRVDSAGRQVTGWNQFPQWGGNQFTGGARDRFFYFTIARERDTFEQVYMDMIEALAARAFPIRGGSLDRAA